MANFADWINQDLQEPALPEHRGGLAFTGDNRSVLIGVHVTEGGAPADLSGSVVAHVVRSADGGTVTFSGLLDGSDVSAVLPEACFAYPGRIAVMLQLVDGTAKTTLCRAVYDVVAGETGTSIDPGSVVPDISDLLARLDQMEQATDAANAAAEAVPAIIAPTFDTSTAYTVGDYVYYSGALYRFTADHAAGAWTGTDAVSVKLAPEVAELKSAFDDIVNQIVENNAYDIIAAENRKHDEVYNGINYIWIDENTCQVSGTATGISINNLLNTDSTTMTLPKGVEPGKKLRLIADIDGTGEVYASVIFGDSAGNLIGTGFYTNSVLEFSVPTNAVRAFIRIYISAGKTVNATIKMRLLTTLTNAELQDSLLTRLSFGDAIFSPAEGATLSLDDAPVNEIVMLDGNGYTECPMPSGSQYGYLMTFYQKKGYGHKFQIFISKTAARQYLRTYAIETNTWNPWNTISDSNNGAFEKKQLISADEDFDTLKISGYYNVISTANGHNKPNIGYGILFVYAISNNYVIQFAANYSNTVLFERTCNGGTWGEWKNIRNVPQINNSYTYNTVTNNITNTPTITTDTHNFLASTNDTTDRTADIVSMIATGYCKLGPGVFYISEVDIPAQATLEGCGNATRVILKSEGTYAFRLKTKSAIRNLRILGSTSDIVVSDTVANRHGIVWYGKASETPASEIPYGAIISNVLIRSFTGGGITCHDTGGSPQASLNVTDLQIENCNAGVNIDYFSEFNSFSNVRMNACYYGCINNGGNNNFTNCRFDGNAMGLLMDNSSGTMRNNSHGSIVGCSFNHNNPGNAYDLVNFGYAIKMYGMEGGEVFSGCQIFYGKILLDNSKGVIFNACNFGIRTQLQIVSNSTAMFANNFISALQSVDKDGTVTVISNGNYLKDGTEVTI